MALILIRGDNESKIVNSILDIENQGHLNLISKPKVINHRFADLIVESILNSKLRTKSKIAVAFFVKESTALSILQIKNIHPPAHVIVVSNGYDSYSKLEYLLSDAEVFHQYNSVRFRNGGMIDYSIDKKDRVLITNDKLNSYVCR